MMGDVHRAGATSSDDAHDKPEGAGRCSCSPASECCTAPPANSYAVPRGAHANQREKKGGTRQTIEIVKKKKK